MLMKTNLIFSRSKGIYYHTHFVYTSSSLFGNFEPQNPYLQVHLSGSFIFFILLIFFKIVQVSVFHQGGVWRDHGLWRRYKLWWNIWGLLLKTVSLSPVSSAWCARKRNNLSWRQDPFKTLEILYATEAWLLKGIQMLNTKCTFGQPEPLPFQACFKSWCPVFRSGLGNFIYFAHRQCFVLFCLFCDVVSLGPLMSGFTYFPLIIFTMLPFC